MGGVLPSFGLGEPKGALAGPLNLHPFGVIQGALGRKGKGFKKAWSEASPLKGSAFKGADERHPFSWGPCTLFALFTLGGKGPQWLAPQRPEEISLSCVSTLKISPKALKLKRGDT